MVELEVEKNVEPIHYDRQASHHRTLAKSVNSQCRLISSLNFAVDAIVPDSLLLERSNIHFAVGNGGRSELCELPQSVLTVTCVFAVPQFSLRDIQGIIGSEDAAN